MHTLYEDGLRKVVEGVTSLDELLNVTEDQTDA
jgi:general secretion pathway protein E